MQKQFGISSNVEVERQASDEGVEGKESNSDNAT